MSNIKIETLTAVHIGTGNILQKDCDFVYQKVVGKNSIGIIDPAKILKLIGQAKIDAWSVAIDKGRDTVDFVRQYSPKSEIRDYTSRQIVSYLSGAPRQIKEFIHDGLNRPYIPGSSIKGAIRTAVLSSIIKGMKDSDTKIRNNANKVTAKAMENTLFGHDPQSDVFRCLQVGDALFDRNSTAAYNMVNINERTSQPYWDKSKQMATEVLPDGDEAMFKMKIVKKEGLPLRPELSSLPNLMSTVNEHTIDLLNSEIKIWQAKDVDSESEAKVEDYVKQLEDMREEAEECQGKKTCVLRVGHGSGWRFITGAWTERLADQEFMDIEEVARPRNYLYHDYMFPKSRRVDETYSEPLGFVKLTLEDA